MEHLLDLTEGIFFLVGAFFSMTLSAAIGFGGSLLMIPAMLIFFPPKVAVAIAALGLGVNNVGKVMVYRADIPWKKALPLALITMIVAGASSQALLMVPDGIALNVIVSIYAVSLLGEFVQLPKMLSNVAAYIGIAIASISSGLSGTAGPTKGLAIRSLGLPKTEMVATGSLISLFGDVSKMTVFFYAGAYEGHLMEFIVFIALVPFACACGYKLNRGTSEGKFRLLFWAIVGAYTLRVINDNFLTIYSMVPN